MQPDDTSADLVLDSSREELSPDERLEDIEHLTASGLAYLSLEELLSELLERVRERMRVDTAAILLLDRDRNVLIARAAKGIEEETRTGVTIPVGRGFAGRLAAERRPIVIGNVDHSYVHNPLLRQKGIKSLLGVPLLVDGGERVIGVLHVGTLAERHFDDADVRLAQLVADRAALAIDNARLSEQRSLTEGLQRVLLPDALPQIPGLRLSAKYLPALESLRIGGDWYDVLSLPDGRVAFVIGDAVGHGVTAASVMSEVRTAVRAYAMERHPPTAIATLVNELLRGMGHGRSATLGMAVLDFETAELEVISAGHPPMLLRFPDGRHEFVGHASGPPLGSFAQADYSSERIEFPDGSSLLLYTDGLIERRGRDLYEGLLELAHALPTAEESRYPLADELFARIGDVSDEDDVAFLAVESLPLEGALRLELDARPIVLTSLRRAISRWLARQGATEPERFDLTLAVSEAAANAVEHAYGPHDSQFEIVGEQRDGVVTFTIRDRGDWRPSHPRSRGRGLTLMSELTDELHVDRDDGGTTVVLTKRLGVAV